MARKATEKTSGKGTKTAAVKTEKVFISEADQYLFSQATHYDIYKKLGPTCPRRGRRRGSILGSGRPMPVRYM